MYFRHSKVQSIGSIRKPSNDPPAQSDNPNDSLYQLQMKNDGLVEKIVCLTYENGQLLSATDQAVWRLTVLRLTTITYSGSKSKAELILANLWLPP